MPAPDPRLRPAPHGARSLRILGQGDAVHELQELALARYDARLHRRRMALRNDAIESVRRLPWLRTVRQGCSLPLNELVIAPMIFGARQELRTHITDLAALLIPDDGRRAAAVDEACARWLEPIAVPAAARRKLIHRRWNEDAVSWARRFEAELLETVDGLHRDHFRPEFTARLDAVHDTLDLRR